jgi:hypothetical protein
MKHSVTVQRSINSYLEYEVDFSDKEIVNITINWFISGKLVNSRFIELAVVEKEIQWIGCPSINKSEREYFNKLLKLIAFG